jgi:hypothetical protein
MLKEREQPAPELFGEPNAELEDIYIPPNRLLTEEPFSVLFTVVNTGDTTIFADEDSCSPKPFTSGTDFNVFVEFAGAVRHVDAVCLLDAVVTPGENIPTEDKEYELVFYAPEEPGRYVMTVWVEGKSSGEIFAIHNDTIEVDEVDDDPPPDPPINPLEISIVSAFSDAPGRAGIEVSIDNPNLFTRCENATIKVIGPSGKVLRRRKTKLCVLAHGFRFYEDVFVGLPHGETIEVCIELFDDSGCDEVVVMEDDSEEPPADDSIGLALLLIALLAVLYLTWRGGDGSGNRNRNRNGNGNGDQNG